MANIPTSATFNNEYPVTKWDRTTVADGKWLQENTIKPLKERDDYLLSLIDNVNSDIPKVPEIIRVTPQGTSFDIDSLKFIQTSTDTAKIQAGSTIVGSTVVQPTLSSQEGKVPVAYYRDGVGYYLLETYKDSRFPDSKSENMNMILTVDEHGTAVWANNNAIKWVNNTNTYAEVAAWFDAGNLVLRNETGGYISMAYMHQDGTIWFTQLNNASTRRYSYTISEDNGWWNSISYKHQLAKGGSCAASNSEAHDIILTLNSSEYTPYSNEELIIDYMAYHAGAFFATLPYTGELFITGTRHNWSLGGSQSPVDELININDTIVLTRDTRTNIGDAFDLSIQELSRTDYRIDWDLIMRFRQGPMDGGAYMSWTNPVHVKISRTSGSSPQIIAGV